MQVDSETGAFRVNTARTCGGFTESGTFRSGALSADVGDVPATVWASVLDGTSFGDARRILVTHLTDLQNMDITYGDERLRVLLDWGHLPYLVRNGSAMVRLAVSAGAWKVYRLDATGKRMETVPSSFADGMLSFTAAVDADPANATFLYEVNR